MTPEGRVKFAIKSKLIAAGVYYHMPVQNGMGAPTLDINGCAKGIRFDIEAKAPGEHATKRQRITMRKIAEAGGSLFLIDGAGCDDMLMFLVWLSDPKPGVIGPQALAEIRAGYTTLETETENPNDLSND